MEEEMFRSGETRAVYTVAWGRSSVPVRRIWSTGLALGRGEARRVPGLVHLYRGRTLVATGLIESEGFEGGEHCFHFKRLTFSKSAPARDYAPEGAAPLALPGPPRIGL